MKKYTTKCKTCGKAFTKHSQLSADQALRMHQTSAHTKFKRSGGGGRKAIKGRRQRQAVVPDLHFCPKCGIDLQTLAVAMLVAGR